MCLWASTAGKGLWETWEIREELHEQASALTQCRHCRKLLGGAWLALSQAEAWDGQRCLALLARKLLKGLSPRAAPGVSERG